MPAHRVRSARWLAEQTNLCLSALRNPSVTKQIQYIDEHVSTCAIIDPGYETPSMMLMVIRNSLVKLRRLQRNHPTTRTKGC